MYDYADVAEYWANAEPGMSHWRSHHGAWSEHGEFHARLAARFEPKSVVEWGVGGGMNPAHIKARPYYAVDISQASLDQAGKYGVTPILIDVGDVTRMELPTADLFLSTAVFQHLPSKGYATNVLELAHRATRHMIVQVRTEGHGDRSGTYRHDMTRACTWSAADFTADLESIGWRIEFMERGHADYLYFGATRA